MHNSWFFPSLHHSHKSFTILGSNTCSSTVSNFHTLLYYQQIPPLHSFHSPEFSVLQTNSSSAQYPLSKIYCTTSKILLRTVSTPKTLLYYKQISPLHSIHSTEFTALQAKSSSAQCKAPQFHYKSKVKPDFTNPLPKIQLTAPPKSTSAKAPSSISGLITPHHGASQAVKGAKHRMRYALDSLLAHDTLLINQRCPITSHPIIKKTSRANSKKDLASEVLKNNSIFIHETHMVSIFFLRFLHRLRFILLEGIRQTTRHLALTRFTETSRLNPRSTALTSHLDW